MATKRSKDIEQFVAKVTPERRQADARTMLDMMERVTGLPAKLSGTAIGFGNYHYKYASGREGDVAAAAFAPRKAATTVYFMDGLEKYADELAVLGPHRTGVGCLYLTDLDKVDLEVLERMVATSYQTLTTGTYTQRARDGAKEA